MAILHYPTINTGYVTRFFLGRQPVMAMDEPTKTFTRWRHLMSACSRFAGGGGEIRTPEELSPLLVFETSALDQLCDPSRVAILAFQHRNDKFYIRPYRLTARTAPFHGVNRGSIPRGVMTSIVRNESKQSMGGFAPGNRKPCEYFLEWNEQKIRKVY
jgi:hypothetical protein